MKNHLGFTSSLAGPELWFKAKTKPDGRIYYAYLSIYVDDVISMDWNAKMNIDKIGKVFKIKDGSSGPLELYLGANIQ